MRKALLLLFVASAAAGSTSIDVAAQDASGFEIRFLTQKEAGAAIVDESMEPYFSLMQPLEMGAKTSTPLEATDLAKQRDECRARYRDAVLAFTDAEQTAINDAARDIRNALKPAYPGFAAAPWSFMKIENSIEGGAPFTHGPHIVIPDWLAQKFASERAKGHDPAKSQLGETLIHEQCHVLQRTHPSLFADFYVNSWGFLRAKGLAACPWIEKHQALDPDGVDVGWVYPAHEGATTTYWQPMATFDDAAKRPRLPKDLVLLGVAVDRRGTSYAPIVPKDAKDGKPTTQFLDQINAYTAAFGRVPENFHPNETFAVMFSWLAMKECVAETGPGLADHSAVDFKKVAAWCKAHFAAPLPKR